jgi:hypothetical protein
MSKGDIKMLSGIILLVSLLLLLSACYQNPTVEVPVVTPKILVTEVVTQVVFTATPEPTHTPVPPATQTPLPTNTPTFDPLSAPIYYPLADCVASRLYVGDVAMVSLVGGPNGVRYGLDMSEATVSEYAQPGDQLEIVDGPWCSHGWIVWLVRTKSGFVGYTPEGNGDEYWLWPVR